MGQGSHLRFAPSRRNGEGLTLTLQTLLRHHRYPPGCALVPAGLERASPSPCKPSFGVTGCALVPAGLERASPSPCKPSFGVTGTKLDALWSLSGNGALAVNNDPPAARLDARLAYGFSLGDALLTPYTEMAWEEGGSTYGAGLRYGLSPSLELDLKGARHHPADGNTESLFLDMRSHF